MRRVLALILLGAQQAWGQAPITDAEKIKVLQDQKEMLAANAEYQKKVTEANDALKATPEYQRVLAAQSQLQKDGQEIYSSRKLKPEDYALCDGPTPGACADVKAGEIALKAKPKAEAKK